MEDKLKELSDKIDAVFVSVEKTRKYFLVIIWITIIAFVIPLIGALFIAPSFLDTYIGSLDVLI